MPSEGVGDRDETMIDDLALWLFVALDSTTVTTPGGRIRRVRELRGLSREEVAAATGIPLTTIKRIETDKVRKSRAIPVLLTYFGLPLDELTPTLPAPPDPNDPPLSQASFLQLWARIYEVYREQTGDVAARFPIEVGDPPPPHLVEDPGSYVVEDPGEDSDDDTTSSGQPG